MKRWSLYKHVYGRDAAILIRNMALDFETGDILADVYWINITLQKRWILAEDSVRIKRDQVTNWKEIES